MSASWSRAWAALLPADGPLGDLPAVHLAAGETQRVLKGQRLMAQVPGPPTRVRLYDETARFLGIGAVDEATHALVAPLVERAGLVAAFNDAWLVIGGLVALSLLALPLFRKPEQGAHST